jgi:hypothetical protein
MATRHCIIDSRLGELTVVATAPADGQLTGDAGGLRRKQFLLDLEEPADVKAARLF